MRKDGSYGEWVDVRLGTTGYYVHTAACGLQP